ncbi:hypothetical protein SORBI_3009G030001 [Sorghum bicolor]|uniref:Uncharacterized protein n=1 Tax=Sorghum bicolor TaxID=4558 RepID=A0A1Z5R0M2_SORBI|nr:hypothetical protein SORBI_3009G030001 [Sorghum bicolor]
MVFDYFIANGAVFRLNVWVHPACRPIPAVGASSPTRRWFCPRYATAAAAIRQIFLSPTPNPSNRNHGHS